MHVCLFAGNLKPISRMAPNGERKPKEKKIYIHKHHREKRHTRNDWINHNKYTNIWYSMRLHSLCNSSKIGNFNSVSKTVFDAIETNLFSKFLKIFHSSISCRLLNIPPNLGSKSNYFERFYFFFLILCLEQHIISPKWIVLNELTLADELKNCFQCQFV